MYSAAAFGLLILSFVVVKDVTCANGGESSSHSLTCTVEGRNSHPTDCTKYVECIRVGGKLTPRVGVCENSAFNPATKNCVSFRDTACQQPRRQARALFEDNAFSYMCSEGKDGFFCADCKTLINCVDRHAYKLTCVNGDMCAHKESFGGGICYPKEPAECTCQEPNSFKEDLYDNRKFFYCNDTSSDPVFYECDEGSAFDAEKSQCKNKNGLPECHRSGVFADINNCTQYYACISTRNGWVQKAFSCNQSNLMYNDLTGACEDPCTWQVGSFACTAEGRYPDPKDCQRYIECVADEGGLKQVRRSCPEDYSWDPTARGGVGHCVKASTNTHCTPATQNKCIIPDGTCASAAVATAATPAPEPTSPSTLVASAELNVATTTTEAAPTTPPKAPVARRRRLNRRLNN
ncbi:peritrophin [Penaeus vannamei]|uniref:Peritrophin n=1 Tax=Penaeus vannamei TaxID=6689 RepID=A0A3R7SLK9_PENVA|nr:uncharacterized protein LOC113819368 [Penaeus vannamei]ROT66024.1 peritrophin [Penaeus vannamei]